MRRSAVLLAALMPIVALPARAERTDGIIVRLRVDAKAQSLTQRLLQVAEDAGIGMRESRALATGAARLTLDHRVPLADAEAAARRIAALPGVLYAEPDRRVRLQRLPNDELLQTQTYLYNDGGGIGALPAWDITTGSPSVVVAVVDTGVRPHADLAGRLLPGYDMIADPGMANDGDGRDDDATDPGDWLAPGDDTGEFRDCPLGPSSWHGTAVAGIIAANTDNHLWAAGVDWYARVLPVRVLGRCGGYTSDIADGIAWAGGVHVPGVPDNPNPAHVINLSLGGDDACPQIYRDAIAAVYAHGTTRAIVAAAGNAGGDVAQSSPANCAGVIAVASTTSQGDLTRYTNTGAGVTLSAPGGQWSSRGTTLSIVVLSNAGLTVPGADAFGTGGGTSYAAPMVSGTVALMLSIAPDLTPAQVHDILVASARPFPAGSTCTTALCGAGIVNAYAALQATAAVAPPATTRVVAEYYDAALDHYFITPVDAEQESLDNGQGATPWTRTGSAFKAWSVAQAGTSPVCRFYIPPALGDSHFFGRGAAECDETRQRNPSFVLEDAAFMQMMLPQAGTCPAGTLPVYRVFSNRADANHRYTTEVTVRDAMVAKGWIAEGDGPDRVVMCAPR